MSQMCEGLAVAHVHGIVHRDIKPGNIFVQDDGSVKILDFGVARLADSNMTASGFIVGTPDFMSPEQARGRGNRSALRHLLHGRGVLLHALRPQAVRGDRPAGGAAQGGSRRPAAAHRARGAGRPLADRLEGACQVGHAPIPGAWGAARGPDALPARLRSRSRARRRVAVRTRVLATRAGACASGH